VISQRLATLHELSTIYSLEDLMVLVEVAIVNAENQEILMKAD
jgi:hypothetical protein